MSVRALVTGFGPFGAVRSNPSARVAIAVADRLSAAGFGARAETLDVTFDVARTAPSRLLADHPGATLLLHVGVAEGRQVVSLERTARNFVGGRPDVSGNARAGSLDVDGPPTRTTAVDVVALSRALVSPVDVEISDDAGDYVCNAIYYASLAAVAARAGVRSLFVHVPPMPDEQADAVGRALADGLSRAG